MARFSEEWIESVKSAWDIVEVVGRRVQLRQTGRNYVGLCPFHSEKTPSFSVNQEKQFYHCFGCHSGGNVINFIMETEHLSFPEAVTKLAQEKGIVVPELSPQENKIEQKRKQLRQVNELAARYYYRNLRQEVGAEARAYLEQRGITQDVARHFYLGYATEAWDGLVQFLQAESVDLELAQEADLVSQGPHGLIDRFRGRVMFPICDHLGRFIGFGGRSQIPNQPKYLNTSQTAVFNKSSVLYGLNWSKDAIKEREEVIVVEGYTDLISLYGAGYKNTVASLGTSFTANHARLLARFTKSVVMAFDGDVAGQEATLRSMEILHDNALLVRVASLADGQDPDTFVRTHASYQVEHWLRSTQPFREYQIDRVISRHDVATREGKLTASTELVTVLAQMTNSIEQEQYIQYGAERLGINEQSLANEVHQKMGIRSSSTAHNRQDGNFVPKHKFRKNRTESKNYNLSEADFNTEKEIMRYLLYRASLLQELIDLGVKASDFQHPEYRHLFNLQLQQKSDAQGSATATSLYAEDKPKGNWEDYLQSFLLVLKRRRLENIEEKLSSLENDTRGFDIRLELYHLLKEYYDISIANIL